MNRPRGSRTRARTTPTLLCTLALLSVPLAFSATAQTGGTGGGPLAGSLHVTVVEAGTDDGTGNPLPVPGAFVMVGLGEGEPFAGNFAFANAQGEVTFTDPALAGPQTVTAGAAGYVFYSFVDVDAAEVVIPLSVQEASVPTSQVTGSLSSFSGVNCDNWLQSAIVIPPMSMDSLIGFNLMGQFTENVALDILGNTVWVPGNLVIPSQNENPETPSLCWLLYATISKPSYILRLPTGTTQDIFSFGVRIDLNAILGGGDFELSQIVPLEIGIARNVNITGNMTVNINMASALNQNLTVITDMTPADSQVLLVSLGEINGDLAQAPGVGDLVLLDFNQFPGGTAAGAVLRTTPVASPFQDLRYLTMAVAAPSSGLDLSGATGVLDRGVYSVPTTRYITSFFLPVQLDPVAGNLFSFSDATQQWISPQPDLNIATLSLVTTVPDTSPGAQPGDTVDVTERLWTLSSPGQDLAFYLPILPAAAPSVLPFPEQTADEDRLVWAHNVTGLSLDPAFDFDDFELAAFPEGFTHFSANTQEFSVDADGDGVHLFADNCPFAANPGQADLDGDGTGDACDSDKDGDGYAVPADCNDLNPLINPGAGENCSDGIDNDCDALIDANDPNCQAGCTDNDHDGYSIQGGQCGAVDCNDANPLVNPGAAELCDGADNDCNPGTADGAAESWFGEACDGPDTDLCLEGVSACTAGSRTCSDSSGNNTESCNGLDDDCDGQLPLSELDSDADLVRGCAGDCDDNNPSVRPGAPELCDGADNNCDGIYPPDEADADGDGYRLCGGDCDDANQSFHPDAPELCDGLDNNCDGIFPPDEADADGDTYRICGGDCDDTRGYVNPAATEVPGDGLDSNCNGDDNCFIATAAYGSLLEPRVVKLRQFRDRVLQQSEVGRQFVKLYYRLSPPVAEFIAERDWLKAAVRTLLLPLIGLASLAL